MSRIYTVPAEYHDKTKKLLRSIAAALRANESLEKQDLTALFLLGDALNTYILAREQLFKDGIFIENNIEQAILPGMDKGISKIANIKTHPALKVANEAWNQATRLLIELNLTPRGRKKPGDIVDLEQENPIEEKSPIDLYIDNNAKTG